MAKMNLSNTLWNDDSSGTIAFVEQLKDRLLHTYVVNNPNYSTTDKNRIPVELKAEEGVFQEKLNEFFLDHWVDFQRFLLDEGVDPETIDSWKEVQEFLEGLPDDEAMWLKNKLAALDTAIAGIDQDGIGIFDVSAYNNIGGTYATYNGLSAALAAIPTASKRSGMTIRYIDSTSNQYKEYRYFLQYEDTAAGNAAFNNTANWQGIDAEPTAGSNNLVKSGGIQNVLALGAVYDVSAKNPTAGPNNDGKWESLSELLSDANLSTLIPTAYRKGGMSIKFVQSSDNKYVCFRLTATSFSTIESDWQEIEQIVYNGSDGNNSLSFIDEDDNCIAQFKGGHIKTKNFNSENATTKSYVDTEISNSENKFAEVDNEEDNDEALAFIDENNNAIAQFKEGHLKTKNFDSRNVVNKNIVAEIDGEDNLPASLSFIDEDDNCIAQFKGGHIKTKNFDSEKVKKSYGTKINDFSSFEGSDWTVSNDKRSASCSTLNSRFSYNNVSYEDNFNMCASIIPKGDTFEVMFGKYYSLAATLISLCYDGNTSSIKYYRTTGGGTLNNYRTETLTNVELTSGRKYFVRIEKRTTTADKYGVTITDEYGNSDTFEPTSYADSHGWGSPSFMIISGTSMTVGDFSFGYPIGEELDLIILGHSYVEGNTLSDKTKKFSYLICNEIGEDKTITLGVGGEKLSDFLTYADQYCDWFSNAKYALLYFGANDGLNPSASNFETKVSKFKQNMLIANTKLLNANIIPVWCTVNWRINVGQPQTDGLNEWILSTFEYVVDVRKVFEDTNGDLDSNKFLSDNIHPSILGHEALYKVIKAQAGYLFNV